MYSPVRNKEKSPLITVYTQVYNTRPFLVQCIESVLSQTFDNFEYILVDNGCTDGSGDILKYYAEKDKRVKLIRYEKNRLGFWQSLIMEQAAGCYLSILDSDDWWERDYLSRMVAFLEANDLDVACTGTMMHSVTSGRQSFRKVDHPIILSRENFADSLPLYHAFLRTVWGKLIRTGCMRKINFEKLPKLFYGGDTQMCFQLLRGAGHIGIDNSVLHHYRIHKSSVSYQYNPKRFEADVYLYNDAVDFLSAYGPISIQNRNFLQAVYSNAIADTVDVIHDSSLSPMGKLQEYRTIGLHPLTQAAYRECGYDDAVRSRKILFQLALVAGAALGSESDEDLRAVAQALSPGCGQAVSARNAPMFLEDDALHQGLFQDNPETILAVLLERVEKNQEIKKYAVPETIRALSMENPLLCQIEDAAFLRRYTKIYRMVWRGENIPALEEMTGLLLENRVSGGKETFLQLYISLAALTNQAPAFVFGKLQLAWLLRRQNRREECRAAVEELTDMGVENEELTALRQELEDRS